MKKIICLILIWFVAFQSAVFASFEEPLDSNLSVHCENESTMMNHDCCQDLVTTSHCNNCFQTTLALESDALLPLTDSDHENIDRFNQLHHPEPLLELFRPPI